MSKKTKIVNLNEVKKPEVKLSPEEEKRKLYSSIKNFVDIQGTDETFDKKNERFNILEYRRHNQKSTSLIGAAKEWSLAFPEEYYDGLRKVLRMPKDEKKPHLRPRIFSRITNDIIYLRFPNGTLKELQKRNPVMSEGNRLIKHHQLLTDIADAHLKQFIDDVIFVIKDCNDYNQFYQRLRKRLGKSWQLPLFEESN